MIDFFIKGKAMRGGISTVCRLKCSSANNKYMKNYNKDKESKYLMYFDVTNLYGHSMCQYLPYGGFEWVNDGEILKYMGNIDLMFKNEEIGYILEVDLVYPTELKNKHIELPLAVEHFNGKLTPNLYSKYNYKVHYMNLRFYLENGMILLKIHSMLRFKQKKWLKEYIDTNTEMRKVTKSESDKNFYKLMNNAVYGKTMENVFNHKNFKLVSSSDKKGFKKNRNNVKNLHIINEDLVLMEYNKEIVTFNKPIYIGFTILELSKLHMYNIHYNVIKKKYNSNATLMYMDTDSLIYEICTEDIYDDMTNDKEFSDIFDMSVYPKNFKCYKPENKGKLGTLKDEFANYKAKAGELSLVTDFTCLRSKCYSLKTETINVQENITDSQSLKAKVSEQNKCKGIPKNELKKISYDDFLNININGGVLTINNTSFRSKNHKIYTITSQKDGLSNLDDKRLIDYSKCDSIYTVPWGYDKRSDLE